MIDPRPELGVIHSVPGDDIWHNCGFGGGGFVSWYRSDNKTWVSSRPAFYCDCSWLIFDKSFNQLHLVSEDYLDQFLFGQ